MMMLINKYGFTAYFSESFDKDYREPITAARIIAEHKSGYIGITEAGELPLTLSGKYRYNLSENGGYPAVGDFAAVIISEHSDRGVIQGILPRKTCFYRRDTFDSSGIQIICANFDTVFICMSLNKNFKVSRLERYLIMAKESMAQIAVILTKADLCRDVEIKVAMCQAVCGDVPVYSVSAADREGLDALMPYFSQGKTVAALGSSGVGKSTLVNALFGKEIMKTSEVREDDDRGRHTTVHRQLIILPSGGMYIDTPGLRELGIIDAQDSVSDIYSDIEILFSKCRFSDCTHNNEPGCAVKKAIDDGIITEERFDRYLSYKKEARYTEDKEGYLREKTAFFKSVMKDYKKIKKKGR